MKRRRLCILAILVFLAACPLSAWAQTPSIAASDVLYLEAGDEILGTLLSSDDAKIVFRTRSGEIIEIPVADVQRVELAPPEQSGRTLDRLGDPELESWIRAAPSAQDMPGWNTAVLYQEIFIKEAENGFIEKKIRTVTKILNEKGKDAGTQSFSYCPDYQEFRILKARSIDPGGAVHDLPHTAIKEAWPHSRFPAYNRTKEVVFALPYSEPGAVVEIEFSVVMKRDPDERPWLEIVSGASGEPVLRKKIILSRRTNSDISATLLNGNAGKKYARMLQAEKRIYDRFPTGEIKTETREANGRAITVWSGEYLPVVVNEPYQPNLDEFLPRICLAKSRTWKGIAGFMKGEIEKRRSAGGEMRDYVRTACAGKIDEAAARALYNKLLSDIRRVHLGPVYNSFVPRAASEIFRDGYANDWDKTFLFYAMLKEAGFAPRLLAARPWSWTRLDGLTPSLRQFQDLVVGLHFGGKTVYASCSDRDIPFGQLPEDLGRGDALVLSDGSGRFFRLPDLKPEENETVREMRIVVDKDGNATVTDRTAYHGAAAFETRWTRGQSDDVLRKHFEGQARTVFKNAVLVSYKLSDRANLEEPSTEEFVYRVIPLDVRSGGKYIPLRLPGADYKPVQAQEGPRRFGVRLGTPDRYKNRYEIILAPGVKFAGLPEPVRLKAAGVFFERKVEKISDRIVVMEDIRESAGYDLPRSKYGAYRDFLFKRQEAGRQKIVLDFKP